MSADAVEYTRRSAVAAVEACTRNISDPRCDEDAAGYLIGLYDKGDHALLPLLVRAGVHADGALAEMLGVFYGELLLDAPQAFLIEISKFPPSKQAPVIFLAATGDGSGISETDLPKIRQNLNALLKATSPSVRRLAATVLKKINEQNQRPPR